MAENKDLEEYKVSTMEDEEDYFDNVEMELDYSISITEGSMELGKDNIKEQKKYMRDSHGDMDDEEFLQNMQSVNNDEAFLRRAAKRLEVYEHQKKVPYFGKFVFKYKDDEEYLPVYVGMSGYQSDMNGQQLVYDWRAPVSSMYYAYEKGPASYNVHVDDMEDDEFSGDIVEKKQFLVSNGRLKDAVDTDSNINDAILLEALGGNSGVKMKNVVATIQKEQDAIIRNRTAYNLIVDGRAGSGKTVIAMHRLAWLLYNYKTLESDNVMILSPNSIFGDYISEVLPELEENSVPEKEFDSLLEELLFIEEEYESKLDQSEFIIDSGDQDNQRMRNIKVKSSISFYDSFNEYLDRYVSGIKFRNFHYQKVEYTGEDIAAMFNGRFARKPVYERFENIAYFIVDRVEDNSPKEFPDEKKRNLARQIQKQMVNLFAERNLVELYVGFLAEMEKKYPGISEYRNEYGKICYEDILPILYLQVYFYGCHSYNNIKHLVIDEMQDYNIFQYAVIDRVFDCKKTILGDRYQVLFYDPEETVVDVLTKIFARRNGRGGYELKELFASYRSTAEITEFCNGILGGEGVGGNTVERHGRVPEEIQCESLDEAVEFINDKLSYGDMDAYDNIAILTNDEADAYEVYKQLSEYTEVTLITNQSVVYAGGVVVLPKFLAKGMEFDAVYVMTDGTYDGSMVTRHAHYIACTRALHELYVLDVEQP
ncbi:superfamily I DNA and RNA helicase [Coprococcus sp. AM14-16]|uniref:HelD family protein n=1 Tax=Coprococcus TaxID=33042 RepID=UPI000E415EC2|nr:MULTISPECIES: ATP-binding domain-containing protein [Coprococcus]RGD39538.1 superfamily I DNA and RNA helicase [Coprococcus sp. AM14-16]